VNNSGDGLLTQPFTVNFGVNELIELVHYVDIETNYDGCNVVVIDGVGETVVPPMAGYPATISTSTYYYAYCVDLHLGLSGHDAFWTTSCFDLSAWDGQMIEVRFDFGSDSSVTYPGWYLAGYLLGTDEGTPVELQSWGTIKALYR
jgi:bacillopeptidase F (M6 metalloprotease family)